MRQSRTFFFFLLIVLQVTALPPLSQSSDRNDVERAIKGLSFSGFEEKRRASDELAKIGTPAVAPLVSLLGEGSKEVRWWAALTLGKIKSASAVPPLIAALGDRDWLVRFFSAWALGEIKDVRAVKPLIDALGDTEFLVVKMAHDSLREITGRDFGEARLPWSTWWVHDGRNSEK